MEYSDILGWAVPVASTIGLAYAANLYEKHQDKISEYIFWHIINPIKSGSLKKELKKQKESDLEKKL